VLTFSVQGPFPVPVYLGRAAKTITSDNATQFWQRNPALADRRGCYVFGMRTGRSVMPLYVGRATVSFRREVFQPHKLSRYQHGLADYKRGTPVLLFVAAPIRRGATNIGLIKELEAFLIQTAISRNSELLNVQGTKRADWSIAGVIRSGVGKPSYAASSLKTSLGL
jgi:hypothetical protein